MDGVEPVAAVVGVAVQGLGAQQVRARLGEGRALGEGGRRHGEDLHTGAVGRARRRGQLEGEGVEERLVVVRVGVGEGVAGGVRVAGGPAVVVDVGAGDLLAVGAGEPVTGEVAGETHLDEVLVVQQAGLLLGRGAVVLRGVGVGVQAGREALDAGVLVEGAAAAHGVAGAVGEGGDAGAGHVLLRGLREPGVIGDLAEVPALAVEDDLLAVDAVFLHGQRVEGLADREDVGLRVVAHEVEAEAVDLVLPGPGDDRVDDELAHHGVLGGRVGAAGAVRDRAVGEEPLVVAGHDPVEDARPLLAARRGVVVDDVHDDPQAVVVQRLHHLPELDRAGRAVRVGGVGALGDRVVVRVVAPVVGVLRGDLPDALLLLVGIGRVGGEVAVDARLVGLALRNGGDVEGGQEVDVRGARPRQLAQVLRAVAVLVGEGEVAAGVLRRAVLDGEVPDVQLLDLGVPEGHGLRLPQRAPAARREGPVVQVDDEAALRVGGEGQGVGVGDLVGDDLADARGPDLYDVPVGLALPGLRAGHGPDAGGGVALHRHGGVADLQCHPPRGRCPDGQRGAAPGERGPQIGLRGVVQVVEDTGDLDTGRREHGTGPGVLRGDDLAAQGLANPVAVARVDGPGVVRLQVREPGLLGVGELRLRQAQPLGVAGEGAVLHLDRAVAGVEQLGGGGSVGAVPGEGVPVDPHRLGRGRVERGSGTHRLREQVLLLAAQQPHLVAVRLEVERLVGRQVLLVALVEDVAEAGGTVGERYLEDRTIGISLDRLEGVRPVGGVRGAGPDVQTPAVVGPVGPVVVQDGLGLVRGRVVGGRLLRADGLLALLDPDLAGLRDVDRAVGGDVLVAVLVDDEEVDVRGAGLELDVGEGAVGVTAGEGVAFGPWSGLAVGEVAPGVQAPVGVVPVGALVVDDRVVPGGGAGRLLGGRGAGGGGGQGARGAAGRVDRDRLVAQGRAGRYVAGDGVGDLVGGVVGGAEGLPLAVAGLGGEDDTVELSPSPGLGGELHGAGGSGRRGLQGDRRLGGGPGGLAGRLEDDRRAGRDGDGELPVAVALQGGVGAVDALEGHAGRAGGEGRGLLVGGVVEGDDVLRAALRVRAREGIDARAVGRVPLLLDAVGEGGVGLAELRESTDLAVERCSRVVGVLGVGAVGADPVVVEVVGGARGEHALPGVLVAARAGEALLVAVVDDGVAPAEEHQLVGEPVLGEDLGIGGLGVVLLQEGSDPAHVVVAEEGDLLVRVGLVGCVLVVVPEDTGELLRAAALGDVLAGRLLEGEVERGVEAALGDVRGGDVRVGRVDLAEHEEVVPALPGRVGVEGRGPLRPELHVDVLHGVDPEAVDAEVPHPALVDPLHAPYDLGPLGPQVVEPGEVAVGGALTGEGGVAPVVVHRRVVEPRRDLDVLLRRGDGRGAREGAGADLGEVPSPVRVVGVVEGLAVLRQIREGALGEVVVGLLLVVDDVRRVVGDDVEVDLHALGVGLVDEGLEVLVGAEVRVDLGEVRDPIAVIARRGVRAVALYWLVLEDRSHPEGSGTQALDVVEPLDQALEVAALVEALVGGVVSGGEAGAGQAALVVARVTVGETVRQHEVELLTGGVVPGGLGGELRVGRGRRWGGRSGGERLDECCGQRGGGDRGDPSGTGGSAP